MTEIDNGGNAFPNPALADDKYAASNSDLGMTLRDWFATGVDKDEYGDVIYRNASRALMEELAGPKPEDALVRLDWELRFRAAIRFRMADAMIAARKGGAL